MMSAKPLTSNLDTWKKHFVAMANGKVQNSKFYRIAPEQYGQGNDSPTVELVTPTQQVVEMARSEQKERNRGIKRRRRRRRPHSTARQQKGKKRQKKTARKSSVKKRRNK